MALLEGPLEMQEQSKGNVLILHFKGKLDAMSAPSAEKKSFDYINKGHSRLVFDFSGVDFLSSAGMRMLLSTSKKLRTQTGHLVLCNVCPSVMDVLVLSGFNHVLEITKSVDEAVGKLQHEG